eukprot:8081846-Lingulodinium_polyedra.AAC.1
MPAMASPVASAASSSTASSGSSSAADRLGWPPPPPRPTPGPPRRGFCRQPAPGAAWAEAKWAVVPWGRPCRRP